MKYSITTNALKSDKIPDEELKCYLQERTNFTPVCLFGIF